MKGILNYVVEWDAGYGETLAALLEKQCKNALPPEGGFASHMIVTRKKVSISEVIALWMSYPGVPESIKNSSLFISLLSITSLALLSPWQLKSIPDSAGEILKCFEMRGFHRNLSKKQVYFVFKDARLAQEGLEFLLQRRLIELDGDDFRLLEVPLSNIKIRFE